MGTVIDIIIIAIDHFDKQQWVKLPLLSSCTEG